MSIDPSANSDPAVNAAHVQLFDAALACEEQLVAAFIPGAVDGERAARAFAQAETLLRALANAEEARVEDSDERGSTDLALQRMEAKLDLLTGLIGALLRRDSPAMPARAICWSRLGIRLASDTASATGERGLLRLQPADWLPEFLEIPVTVIASETSDTGSRLWLRFDPLPAALESALDRHLFRAHRRQIADARRQRIVPAN